LDRGVTEEPIVTSVPEETVENRSEDVEPADGVDVDAEQMNF